MVKLTVLNEALAPEIFIKNLHPDVKNYYRRSSEIKT